MTAKIHGTDCHTYPRLHDIMLALMCWNWDFEVDTFSGTISIPGYSRAEFIIAAIEDKGGLIPEDLEFELGQDSSDVILKVRS